MLKFRPHEGKQQQDASLLSITSSALNVEFRFLPCSILNDTNLKSFGNGSKD
jgi:hypothetical protein